MRKVWMVGMLLIASPALAHHSFAVFFDTEQKMTEVTGVVQEFRFSNPHGVITLMVRKGAGSSIWRAETNSPSILRRRGWTPESLKIGETVTVRGWPARDGTPYLRMQSVRRADGSPVGQPLGGG